MKAARVLLKALMKAIPPGPGQHHAMTVPDGEGLVVTVYRGPSWQAFTLDEVDMEREPEAVAEEIAKMLEVADAANAPPGEGSKTVLHLVTQENQPYGSERRCCQECGIMTIGANQPPYTDRSLWTSPQFLTANSFIRCSDVSAAGGNPHARTFPEN
jgi:hypothetical protein